MVEVANVHAPYLVPSTGLERHLLLLLGTPLRFFEAVELAVDSEDAPAGTGAEVDAQLRQSGGDAELPELRVLLQFSNLVHRPEVYLALSTAGFVLKAVDVLCDPLIQCPVDGWTAGL